MGEFVYNEEIAAVFNELFWVWRSSLSTEAQGSHKAALLCWGICNRDLSSLQRKSNLQTARRDTGIGRCGTVWLSALAPPFCLSIHPHPWKSVLVKGKRCGNISSYRISPWHPFLWHPVMLAVKKPSGNCVYLGRWTKQDLIWVSPWEQRDALLIWHFSKRNL